MPSPLLTRSLPSVPPLVAKGPAVVLPAVVVVCGAREVCVVVVVVSWVVYGLVGCVLDCVGSISFV